MDATTPTVRRRGYSDPSVARRAARLRWAGHEPRHVDLKNLTDAQRRLVLALINAARAEAIRDDAA